MNDDLLRTMTDIARTAGELTAMQLTPEEWDDLAAEEKWRRQNEEAMRIVDGSNAGGQP